MEFKSKSLSAARAYDVECVRKDVKAGKIIPRRHTFFASLGPLAHMLKLNFNLAVFSHGI